MKHQINKIGKWVDSFGPSRKFFIILLSLICSIALHSLTKFSSWDYLSRLLLIPAIGIFTILAIAKIVKNGKYKNSPLKPANLFFIAAIFISFMAGIWLYESSLIIPKDDVSFLNGQKITLRGVISEEPDKRLDHQKLKVSVKSLTSRKDADSNAEGRGRIGGKLLVRTELYPEFNYGDEIELTCDLQKPEPIKDFAYDEYLARDDIYSVCFRSDHLSIVSKDNGDWFMGRILFFKKNLSQNISAALAEPYASLARGIALGERGTIPRDIQENFRRAGLSHILAISGFNITIVIALVGLFIKSLVKNKTARFFIISASIIFFVLLVGADASVVRAAIMGTLALLAKSNARVPPPRITLSLAGAIMLAQNPKLIAFDRGFLLSFAATFGLIYLAPLFREYLGFHQKNHGVIVNFLVGLFFQTTAAIIFTLPLVIYFFKNLSLVALLANIAVVPVASIILVMSLLAGIFGFIKIILTLIMPVLYASIFYTDFVSRLFAQISSTSINFSYIHWMIMPILYGTIFYLMFLIKKKVDKLNLV